MIRGFFLNSKQWRQAIGFSIVTLILLLWSSCRTDLEFSTTGALLEFSKDTVYLDTVFTNIGSSTYNLKVYNPTNDNVLIPSIQLKNGVNSFYRLNVDGISSDVDSHGKQFENVELLAKDSLFIFIETTIDINQLSAVENQFLYTDQIVIDNGNTDQNIELVTLVKDANFIYPQRDETTGMYTTLSIDLDDDGLKDETGLQGRFLTDDELHFSNTKPYVVYGYAAVDTGKTLQIDAGARIHFHANSGLLITAQASLHINGTYSENQESLENEVIFEGDRLEPGFMNIPGQWGTIWLMNNSTNNQISYTTIRNGTIGILSDGNAEDHTKLNLKNSQIYNHSNYGVLGRNTYIKAENLVTNQAGQSSFAGVYGGNYLLIHCTIANYWNHSFRDFPALLMQDYILDENNSPLTNNLHLNISNSIIYGNNNVEFFIETEGAEIFDFHLSHNLIKFDNNDLEGTPLFDFSNTANYTSNLINELPHFLNPQKNQMIIGEESAAINNANSIFASQVPLDLLQINRTTNPDIGAYQHIVFEN